MIGNGEFVLSQTPSKNDTVSSSLTKVILYTEASTVYITVPTLVGMEISDASKICIELGLNIRLSGSIDGGTVVYQSLPSGAKVEVGALITLRSLIDDFED